MATHRSFPSVSSNADTISEYFTEEKCGFLLAIVLMGTSGQHGVYTNAAGEIGAALPGLKCSGSF